MKDKFIVLSHSMIRRKDLTMQEKIIYLEILNLSSLENGCFASNGHFEKCFGISKKSVSNTISSLVLKGLIEVELKDRNNTRIISIKDGGVSIKDGGVSIKDGETKDNIQSNILINNTYVDYDFFSSKWNRFAEKYNKPKIIKLSDSRKKKISTRIKENDKFNLQFNEVLGKATESTFLSDGSFFNFDWIIENDTNYLKVLEDKYKDKEWK